LGPITSTQKIIMDWSPYKSQFRFGYYVAWLLYIK